MRPLLALLVLPLLALPFAPWGLLGDEAALPAGTVRVSPGIQHLAYPILGQAGEVLGTQTWRVILGTGNCCENYVTTTPGGRIVDFGGNYPLYSDDRGLTWTRVTPTTPMVGGEGAIATAPNGDVVGIGWSPYAGDRIQSFRYVAAENRWDWSEVLAHGPFYDRPWIYVAPGPFEVGGSTYPYVVFASGGVPKRPYLMSLDGLNYVVPSGSLMGGAGPERAPGALDQPARAWADYVQPKFNGFTPLPGGGGLEFGFPCGWARFDVDLTWGCWSPTVDLPHNGTLRVDSRGWIHVARAGTSVLHMWSADGGRTWTSRTYALPEGFRTVELDFKVHGGLDVAAFGIHGRKGSFSQDLVLKVDDATSQTPQARTMLVGKGDLSFGSGITTNGPRFDFLTIGLLPDGKVVTSFGDSAHRSPALAIET